MFFVFFCVLLFCLLVFFLVGDSCLDNLDCVESTLSFDFPMREYTELFTIRSLHKHCVTNRREPRRRRTEKKNVVSHRMVLLAADSSALFVLVLVPSTSTFHTIDLHYKTLLFIFLAFLLVFWAVCFALWFAPQRTAYWSTLSFESPI